ncbi:hypothetical protein DIPPA_24256 [Diplonema papillatum]|nr:hypothetical protein DIPPA_24256 [Diplonema papillatum]|eukprot:gene110-165_t
MAAEKPATPPCTPPNPTPPAHHHESTGSARRPFSAATSRGGGSLGTWDIPGAQAGTWRSVRQRNASQASRTLDTHDVEGARSSVLIPSNPRKRTDAHLNVSDIIGARPKPRYFTSRVTNPVDPVYDYPRPIPLVSTPPKKLRDLPYAQDITTYRKPQRPKPAGVASQYLDYSDAVKPQGTQPGPRPSMNLETKDITSEKRPIGRRSQASNPLTPRYIYDVPPAVKAEGQVVLQAWLDRQKEEFEPSFHPARLPRERKDRPLFSLRNVDIDCSSCGDPWLPPKFPKQRRGRRMPNYIADIEKSSPSKNHATFHRFNPDGRGTFPSNPDYSVARHFRNITQPSACPDLKQAAQQLNSG